MRRDEDEALEDEDARRWQRAKNALAEALELPPEARTAMLADLRGRDPALAEEVASLLAAHDQTSPQLMGLAPGVVNALVREHADALRLGQQLGAYRLVRRIGSGGMGDVYLGERADGAFEKQVAIKVLRDGLVGEGAVLRFERERQILARLDHANLAKVFDGGVTAQGLPYFVMELVDGRPLTDYCDAHDLNVRERVALMRAVCQVVHYVHQRGVIHRDLKPRNILVTPEGQIKLVDFGIAKLIEPLPQAAPDETATALRAMTPLYSSPEQVRGQAVGPASDVYALGVVLCRLLAGRSPYDLETTTAASFELARAICEEEPLRLSEAAAGQDGAMPPRLLRGDLDAVVAKALRKDPAARYQSAEQMADDLFRHLERLPVGARRGATGYRLGRWLVRHRAVAAGALVANLALVLALGLAAYEGLRANAERQRAQRHFESVRRLANVFIFDVYKQIERVPGSMEARGTLVDTALTYLEQLHAESHGDASLQLEIAEGYANVGDLQGGSSVANLGDSKAALASFDQALVLVRPLMNRPGPWQEQARGQFVTITARKGAVLMAGGSWKEAEAIELEGLQVARAQTAAAPDDRAAAGRLVAQMAALVQMYLRSGNVAAFDGLRDEYLREAQQRSARDPADPDAAVDLGSAYSMRAVNLMQNVKTRESMHEALFEFRKALEVLEPAYRKNPLHSRLAGQYGRTEGYLGHLYVLLLQPRSALEHLRRAVEVSEAVAAKDPKDVRNRKELADAHGRLGQALFEMHDADGAVEETRLALAAFGALPEASQSEVAVQYNRAITHHQLGLALDAQAASDSRRRRIDPPKSASPAACEEYRVAKGLLEENARRRPNSRLPRELMTSVDSSLGRCAAPGN